MVFIALWFLLSFCGIFSSSSCDSCINVFVMDWAACWCVFCASLRPDCRIVCLCWFLHVTMNLVTHCAPLLAATRHGASLVQPQVTLNCVHTSVGDEAYHCTPLHGSECTDRHGLSYTRDQLLRFQAGPLGPSLTSHLTELGIRYRFPRKRSSRGGRRKQRRITVVCCGAARELVAKRWLEVVSCDPCHCFSAAISAIESDTRCVVLPRCHTAVLHAASSLLYDVPSIVLDSRCDTANLRTSTLYDVPSTVLVSRCDTAILRTSTLYDVPSIVLVSLCDTAVLRTSTLYDVPSIVLVSWCDAAVLRTSTLYDVPSIVLVSWCDAAVLRTFTLYDVPSTVLVSWCNTAVLRTPHLRRPFHRARLQV